MNARQPIGLLATSPAAIQRAAQMHEQLAEARAEGIRCLESDADASTVLEQLVEAGKLDAELVETMLFDAAAARLSADRREPNVSQQRLRRVLSALDKLIAAVDGSLDYSAALQRAKSDAYSVWVQAGGPLEARHV